MCADAPGLVREHRLEAEHAHGERERRTSGTGDPAGHGRTPRLRIAADLYSQCMAKAADTSARSGRPWNLGGSPSTWKRTPMDADGTSAETRRRGLKIKVSPVRFWPGPGADEPEEARLSGWLHRLASHLDLAAADRPYEAVVPEVHQGHRRNQAPRPVRRLETALDAVRELPEGQTHTHPRASRRRAARSGCRSGAQLCEVAPLLPVDDCVVLKAVEEVDDQERQAEAVEVPGVDRRHRGCWPVAAPSGSISVRRTMQLPATDEIEADKGDTRDDRNLLK